MIGSDDELGAEVRARVGSVLGRKYRLERVLGVGGMGAVYEAVHRNGARVAVKVLHRAYATSEDVLRRFVREGLLANRIAHRGVVRILDDDRAEDGSVYLVMDLLEGATCRELADQQGGRLSVRDTLVVTRDVLLVLEVAHREGIVHRDIKPNNVFVTRDGEVKLLDFGIARLSDRSAPLDAVTHSGVALGTPGFMCPEQVLGRSAEIDARSDIWAVGAMMFNLVAGENVHLGTAQEIAVYTATRGPRTLRDVADAPAALSDVVDRALALAPHHRWQSARAMLGALELAYRDVEGGSFDEARVAPPAAARIVSPMTSRDPPPPRGVETIDPLPARAASDGAPVAALAATVADAPRPPGDESGGASDAAWAPTVAVTPRPREASPPLPPRSARGRWALAGLLAAALITLVARVGVPSRASLPPVSGTTASPTASSPPPVAPAPSSSTARDPVALPLPAPSDARPLPTPPLPAASDAHSASVARPRLPVVRVPTPHLAHDAPGPAAAGAGQPAAPSPDPLQELDFR